MKFKILSFVMIILWVAEKLLENVFPHTNLIFAGVMYISFVVLRKNYWFNLLYELFLAGMIFLSLFVYNSHEYSWLFILTLFFMIIYLPLIILQEKLGYKWFEV